jgi:hypothetical protein
MRKMAVKPLVPWMPYFVAGGILFGFGGMLLLFAALVASLPGGTCSSFGHVVPCKLMEIGDVVVGIIPAVIGGVLLIVGIRIRTRWKAVPHMGEEKREGRGHTSVPREKWERF